MFVDVREGVHRGTFEVNVPRGLAFDARGRLLAISGDRLLRYESHAERSMIRAIETLSRLRGVTVESIRATMSSKPSGEQSLEVRGERTTWPGS